MQDGKELLTVYSVSTGYKWYRLETLNLIIKNNEQGFYQCSFSLAREFSFAYDDIGINFQIFVRNSRGDTAWHGEIRNIQASFDGDNDSIEITAFGFWATASDITYAGTLATSSTPEAMIALLYTGNYLRRLSGTSLYNTGLTARRYETPDAGTQDVRVAEVIKAICDLGDSTGATVVPAVWENRTLVTKAIRRVTPTPKYLVQRKLVKSLSLSRSENLIANNVVVRYTNDRDSLIRLSVAGTVSQAELGADYTGLGTVTPLIRSQLLDITGLGQTNSATATAAGQRLLNTTSRMRNESQNIILATEYSVFDVEEGQEIPLSKVKGSFWLQIPDLFPRPNEVGSGTTAGDAVLSTFFYITAAEYNYINGELTIIPEKGSDLAEII